MTAELRNYEAFAKSLRCFDSWLGDSAPGAMDIDCLIERRGHVLIFELKPWTKGVGISYGSYLSLRTLSRMPLVRVYIVGEGSGDALHLCPFTEATEPVVGRHDGTIRAWFPPARFVPSTPEGLRTLVRAWWDDASAQ